MIQILELFGGIGSPRCALQLQIRPVSSGLRNCRSCGKENEYVL